MKGYQILNKNGSTIFERETTDAQDFHTLPREATKIIPRHYSDHNGDRYDFFDLSFDGSRVLIGYCTNMRRNHIDSDTFNHDSDGKVEMPLDTWRTLVSKVLK